MGCSGSKDAVAVLADAAVQADPEPEEVALETNEPDNLRASANATQDVAVQAEPPQDAVVHVSHELLSEAAPVKDTCSQVGAELAENVPFKDVAVQAEPPQDAVVQVSHELSSEAAPVKDTCSQVDAELAENVPFKDVAVQAAPPQDAVVQVSQELVLEATPLKDTCTQVDAELVEDAPSQDFEGSGGPVRLELPQFQRGVADCASCGRPAVPMVVLPGAVMEPPSPLGSSQAAEESVSLPAMETPSVVAKAATAAAAAEAIQHLTGGATDDAQSESEALLSLDTVAQELQELPRCLETEKVHASMEEPPGNETLLMLEKLVAEAEALEIEGVKGDHEATRRPAAMPSTCAASSPLSDADSQSVDHTWEMSLGSEAESVFSRSSGSREISLLSREQAGDRLGPLVALNSTTRNAHHSVDELMGMGETLGSLAYSRGDSVFSQGLQTLEALEQAWQPSQVEDAAPSSAGSEAVAPPSAPSAPSEDSQDAGSTRSDAPLSVAADGEPEVNIWVNSAEDRVTELVQQVEHLSHEMESMQAYITELENGRGEGRIFEDYAAAQLAAIEDTEEPEDTEGDPFDPANLYYTEDTEDTASSSAAGASSAGAALAEAEAMFMLFHEAEEADALFQYHGRDISTPSETGSLASSNHGGGSIVASMNHTLVVAAEELAEAAAAAATEDSANDNNSNNTNNHASSDTDSQYDNDQNSNRDNNSSDNGSSEAGYIAAACEGCNSEEASDNEFFEAMLATIDEESESGDDDHKEAAISNFAEGTIGTTSSTPVAATLLLRPMLDQLPSPDPGPQREACAEEEVAVPVGSSVQDDSMSHIGNPSTGAVLFPSATAASFPPPMLAQAPSLDPEPQREACAEEEVMVPAVTPEPQREACAEDEVVVPAVTPEPQREACAEEEDALPAVTPVPQREACAGEEVVVPAVTPEPQRHACAEEAVAVPAMAAVQAECPSPVRQREACADEKLPEPALSMVQDDAISSILGSTTGTNLLSPVAGAVLLPPMLAELPSPDPEPHREACAGEGVPAEGLVQEDAVPNIVNRSTGTNLVLSTSAVLVLPPMLVELPSPKAESQRGSCARKGAEVLAMNSVQDDATSNTMQSSTGTERLAPATVAAVFPPMLAERPSPELQLEARAGEDVAAPAEGLARAELHCPEPEQEACGGREVAMPSESLVQAAGEHRQQPEQETSLVDGATSFITSPPTTVHFEIQDQDSEGSDVCKKLKELEDLATHHLGSTQEANEDSAECKKLKELDDVATRQFGSILEASILHAGSEVTTAVCRGGAFAGSAAEVDATRSITEAGGEDWQQPEQETSLVEGATSFATSPPTTVHFEIQDQDSEGSEVCKKLKELEDLATHHVGSTQEASTDSAECKKLKELEDLATRQLGSVLEAEASILRAGSEVTTTVCRGGAFAGSAAEVDATRSITELCGYTEVDSLFLPSISLADEFELFGPQGVSEDSRIVFSSCAVAAATTVLDSPSSSKANAKDSRIVFSSCAVAAATTVLDSPSSSKANAKAIGALAEMDEEEEEEETVPPEHCGITASQLSDVALLLDRRCEAEGWQSVAPSGCRRGSLLRPQDVTFYDLSYHAILPQTLTRGLRLTLELPLGAAAGSEVLQYSPPPGELEESFGAGLPSALGRLCRDALGTTLQVTPVRGQFTAGRNIEVAGVNVGLARSLALPKSSSRSWVGLCMPGKRQSPSWFVSHWWGDPVKDFVACVTEHAKVREQPEDGAYWVCAFSNDLHSLPQQGGANLYDLPFYRALQLPSLAGVLSILNRERSPSPSPCPPSGSPSSAGERRAQQHGKPEVREATFFQRMWCGFELFAALELSDRRKEPLLMDVGACLDQPGAGGNGGCGATAAVLIQGLTQIDQEREVRSPTQRGEDRLQRQAKFPVCMLLRGLEARVEDGLATEPDDCTRLLICMAQDGKDVAAARRHQPHLHQPSLNLSFERANARLQSLWASLAWPRLLQQVQQAGGTDSLSGELGRRFAEHLREDEWRKDLQLSFRHLRGVSDKRVKEVARSLPCSLVSLSLDLHGCRSVSSIQDLSVNLACMDSLKKVSLSLGSTGISRVDDLGKGLGRMQGLTSLCLGLQRCKKLSSVDALGAGLTKLGSLKSLTLDLSGCHQVSSVDALGRSVGALKKLSRLSLSLADCKQVTDLNELGKSLGSLEALDTLTLNLCWLKQVVSLRELGKGLGQLHNLKSVAISWVDCKRLLSIDDLGWAVGQLRSLTSLSLNLAGCTAPAEALGKGLQQLQSLTELSISLASCLKMTSIDELSRGIARQHGLTRLMLKFHTSIQLASVDELGKALGNLRHLKSLELNLACCEKITSVDEVGKGLAELHELTSLTLDLHGCSKLRSVDDLGRGLGRARRLTFLSLDCHSCTQLVSVDEVGKGLANLVNLTSLSLDFFCCRAITSIDELGRGLAQLTELKTSSLCLVRLDEIVSLRELGHGLASGLGAATSLHMDLARGTDASASKAAAKAGSASSSAADDLGKGLAELRCLTELDLSLARWEQITSVEHLGHGIGNLRSLRTLSLNLRSCVGLTSVDHLGHGLGQLSHLTKLSLVLASCTSIISVDELGKGLAEMHSLRSLSLFLENCVKLSSVDALGTGIGKLHGLGELTLYLSNWKHLRSVDALGRAIGELRSLREAALHLIGCQQLESMWQVGHGLVQLQGLATLHLALAGCVKLPAGLDQRDFHATSATEVAAVSRQLLDAKHHKIVH